MTVTAKLSQSFYDTLGEKVANELVDWLNQVDSVLRAELKDLQDAGFLRFDAGVSERFTRFGTRLEGRFREFQAGVKERLGKSEVGMDDRFSVFEANIEERFDSFAVGMKQRFKTFTTAMEKASEI
ncbi:MAG: hypothetical protein OEY63_00655 [Gemmatimonadota bacterium]|nr:hypothetical protein [Gemmatimonadota bacterium]MDH5805007.1 hypothetical protein [Gemmatimonadota bacterium]